MHGAEGPRIHAQKVENARHAVFGVRSPRSTAWVAARSAE